jgi:hypothetical protein
MKEPGSPKKVRLGAVRNAGLRNPFQETPECSTLASANTAAVDGEFARRRGSGVPQAAGKHD